MALTAIHPGEHLAEELQALDNDRGWAGAKDRRAHQSSHANLERNALHYG